MTHKDYNTVDDFLSDASFKNWVFNSQLTDVSFWNLWLVNNPHKKMIALEAKDILLGIKFKKYDISDHKIDFEWHKLKTKLEAIHQNHPEITPSKRNRKYFLTGIAASLLLLSSIGFHFFYKEFSLITHKTSYGEVLKLKLNDGTFVTLNANSSISYRKNDFRNISLKGEAFFKVSKKENHNTKFSVKTDDLIVKVFGTEFNVNSQKNKTKVFLEKGNIWLNLNNGTSKKMVPGNYIEYSSRSKKIIVDDHLVSSDRQLAWKNGKLIFKNSTLLEALNKISDTYGIVFDFYDDKTKEIRITGVVPTTNLEICLKAIKKSANISIQKENTKLVVFKN